VTGRNHPDPQVSERRRDLLGVKLRALVAAHLGISPTSEVTALPDGAAMVVDEQAWVLTDGDSARQLGPALAWAIRRGATSLQMIAETGAGVLARRATAFEMPIGIWAVDEHRSDVPSLTAVMPDQVLVPASPDDDHLEFGEVIVAAGAELCVEHGVVTGEVRGLEVCRVIDDDAGSPRLEVGVGAQDREIFAMVHAETPVAASLERVVATVERHRQPDADPHPLNRMARERLLRWWIGQQPERIGARLLEAVEPPVARRSVADVTPCLATGPGRDDRRVLVVCSSGVDLDLVPFAADARLRSMAEHGGSLDAGSDDGRRLVLVIPERDRLRLTADLLGLLSQAPGWSDPELISVESLSAG